MLVKRVALLVVAFIFYLAMPASAAEDGVILGQLVNGTEGGSSIAKQEITLDTHLNDVEVALITIKTDAEGQFVFNGLSTEPGYSYLVTLAFQEANYSSEWLTFAEGEASKFTEITVYDSTISDEAIGVTTSHTVIYIAGGALEVWDYFLFVNESDLTYIGAREVSPTPGGTRETLRFSLPEGISELQPSATLMECCIYVSEEGFIDTMPVLPGVREIAYSYKVDYSSDNYVFSYEVNYPVASFDLFVQGESTIITSDQLTAQESMVVEDIWYNHFSSQTLALGDTLDIRLSGLPKTDNQQIVLWVTLTLVLLSGGFGLFYYLLRKKRPQQVRSVGNLSQRRQRLLVELAKLDDDFDVGKIQGKSYHRLRSVKKARLIQLMQEPQDKSGSG
jgi:hypothetical protein|tara:strand:+ start:959 stop:2131 length:1173 start_codon:yes stop_codon:yes gene_type:complete